MKNFLALLRPSEAVGVLSLDCAILGIFGLLICIAGARLTDLSRSHVFELGTLCGSAESDLITPLRGFFRSSLSVLIIAQGVDFVKRFLYFFY